MASSEQNRRLYDQDYAWADAGEEWSWPWGGSDQQWYGTWLPRIQRFLPAGTVLEIGAGFGRWSQYLRRHCETLLLVDIAPRCIDACRERFADDPQVRCFVNDGSSLDDIADGSVDFVCSFDSLVHVDADVLGRYIEQIAVKLSDQGCALLHHSNLHACQQDPQLGDEPMLHDRDPTVSAEFARRRAERAGLCCPGQELINWGTRRVLLDALTTLARPASVWAGAHRLLSNPHFMDEVATCGRLAELYGQRQRAAPPIEL